LVGSDFVLGGSVGVSVVRELRENKNHVVRPSTGPGRAGQVPCTPCTNKKAGWGFGKGRWAGGWMGGEGGGLCRPPTSPHLGRLVVVVSVLYTARLCVSLSLSLARSLSLSLSLPHSHPPVHMHTPPSHLCTGRPLSRIRPAMDIVGLGVCGSGSGKVKEAEVGCSSTHQHFPLVLLLKLAILRDEKPCVLLPTTTCWSTPTRASVRQ
jgi:hypothetical protein